MSNLVADPGAPAKAPVKLVYNRSMGRRFYILKNGKKLLPGQSAEVSVEEYNELVNYKDIVDAEKMIPKAAEKSIALTKENTALKAQLAGLHNDPVIAERLKEIAEAQSPKELAPQSEAKPEKKEAPKKGKGR